MSGYDQLDPNITALYDIPSFLPNSDGKLRSDKPYQAKLYSCLCVSVWGSDCLGRCCCYRLECRSTYRVRKS